MDTAVRTALKQVHSIVALATITWVKGSTPHKTGAGMLVFPDGTTVGSIGGGYGGAKVIRFALNAIAQRTSRKCTVNMSSGSEEEEQVMPCGVMEVLIDILSTADLDLLKSYVEKIEAGAQPVLATVVNTPPSQANVLGEKLWLTSDGISAGKLEVPQLELLTNVVAKRFWNDDKAKSIRINFSGKVADKMSNVEIPEWEVLIDPPPRQVELVLLGGGHIALALAKLAKTLDFRVIVIDDQQNFANKERFPMADEVMCEEFTKGIAGLKLGADSYVVIVTRGHRFDKECFRSLVTKPLAYLGMVANPQRARSFFNYFKEEGLDSELLDKLHAPVGLNLGASNLLHFTRSVDPYSCRDFGWNFKPYLDH